MLGDFMKRLVNGAVFLLAALTFFLVPIGRKTAAQHTVAIFSTPPAREAASALAEAARSAAGRAGGAFTELRAAHGKHPSGEGGAAPRASADPGSDGK